MTHTALHPRQLLLSLAFILALIAAFALAMPGVSSATGPDSPAECDDPTNVVTANDSPSLETFAIGIPGEIVAVCIGSTDGHSELINTDDGGGDCIGVTGFGTSQVLITRNTDCAALTHVDVFFLPVAEGEVFVSDSTDEVTVLEEEEDEEEEVEEIAPETTTVVVIDTVESPEPEVLPAAE